MKWKKWVSMEDYASSITYPFWLSEYSSIPLFWAILQLYKLQITSRFTKYVLSRGGPDCLPSHSGRKQFVSLFAIHLDIPLPQINCVVLTFPHYNISPDPYLSKVKYLTHVHFYIYIKAVILSLPKNDLLPIGKPCLKSPTPRSPRRHWILFLYR